MKNFFKSKLKLNKETVTKLNKDQMNKVIGGIDTLIAGDTVAVAPPKDTARGGEKAKQDSLA